MMIVLDTTNGKKYKYPDGTLIPSFYKVVTEGAEAPKATEEKAAETAPKAENKAKAEDAKAPKAEDKAKAEEAKTTKAEGGKE